MQRNVLIIGGDHYNTLGIIESLGRKGIRSYVILNTPRSLNYVSKSKYVINAWTCSTDESILNCMLSNFSSQEEKTIVFPSSDYAALFLDTHYNILTSSFELPGIASEGSLKKLMNKEVQSELARKVGLNVAPTWIVKNCLIPDDITYPCITKAIMSAVGSKMDLKVCYNRKQLKAFAESEGRCHILQVQQFIDKDIEFQFLGVSLGGGEIIVMPGVTQLKRNDINNASFLEYDYYDDSFANDVRNCKTFIRECKYSGLFSIEFIRSKDGVDYFLEMNLRNDGNSICCTDAGLNLSYIWYLYITGGDYKSEIDCIKLKRTYWMPEFFYFLDMVKGIVPFKQWIKEMLQTNSFSNFFKDDLKPGLYFLFIEMTHGINKLLRKLHLKK